MNLGLYASVYVVRDPCHDEKPLKIDELIGRHTVFNVASCLSGDEALAEHRVAWTTHAEAVRDARRRAKAARAFRRAWRAAGFRA